MNVGMLPPARAKYVFATLVDERGGLFGLSVTGTRAR